MSNLKLDITIPILNEESRLERGVTKTVEFLEKSEIKNYSITLADNGSTDNTEKLATNLTERFPAVRALKVDRRGVGLALKQSWASSDADLIGYMDVDLATDLNHILEVYQIFQNNDEVDIINGSRLLPNSQVSNRSILRGITSRGFNFLLNTMLDVKFSDGMCGFKFLKKTSYDKIFQSGLENDGWFFCTELLVKAEWMGMRICEIPVKWEDDDDSRVRLFKTIMSYSKEIKRLKLQKAQKY
ncbi:MAG: glycosyltransferase [Nitrospina sp.]|nr:glycosyltransferase [Nitrospina sp.]MBT4048087.1 glycosyltransferase [Nitrospina sp.]MBT7196463.1 glycosyltransferase [Nitrospina sp.]